jgi:hypothetical protein
MNFVSMISRVSLTLDRGWLQTELIGAQYWDQLCRIEQDDMADLSPPPFTDSIQSSISLSQFLMDNVGLLMDSASDVSVISWLIP